jgi:hypothetical protein
MPDLLGWAVIEDDTVAAFFIICRVEMVFKGSIAVAIRFA